MSELQDVARSVLNFAVPGEQVEAYGIHRVATTIQADTRAAVRQVSVAETRGVGVRVIYDHRLGYASTSDLSTSTLKLTLERARANAAASDPDDAQTMPRPQALATDTSGLLHQDLERASLQDKIALVVDLARNVVARDPRVSALDTAEYHDETKTVAVASTEGIDLEQRVGFLEIWSDALGEDSATNAVEGVFESVRSPKEVDVERLADTAVRRTIALLGSTVAVPTGVPIIIDPDVVPELLHAVGKGLSGGALSSGRSPFLSEQGKAVASPNVELVDDGVSAQYRNAGVFDDEGLPRQRTTLISDGTLVGALHSSVTARAVGNGAVPTGNARRGSYKSVPRAAPHCLVLTPTSTSQELFARAGRAIYIQQLTGGGVGVNAITGRVEVGGVGWLVEDGENVGRLPVISISTTLLKFLRSIIAIGDDTRQAETVPAASCTVLCSSELLGS